MEDEEENLIYNFPTQVQIILFEKKIMIMKFIISQQKWKRERRKRQREVERRKKELN